MAGKKAGRKQESGRPGIRHDAAPGRILGGHSSGTVSYTHLDVYKRQGFEIQGGLQKGQNDV